ncbi:VrrA/YqfQ family protein [Niallia sp. Krafla_26]|uniref:VrrA/YqfQ family protein n=1 Tax=Niallia sp. Krafla_26 TaxID=3064703 RepID=UPI003D17E6FB
MYPRYQHPHMQHRMPPQGFHSYNRMPPANPMMARPRLPQQRGGGGFLSRLFNQTGNRAAVQPFSGFGQQAARGGGGLLKTLSNPNTINGFLTNTQKVLSTAQQVGPMVQQYGPIVKNIPMMWKLYRGLKDAPEFSKNQDESSSSSKSEKKDVASYESSSSDHEADTVEHTNNQPSPSKPKLYI